MNDYLAVYIERDVAHKIENEKYHATILKYETLRRQLKNFMYLCVCVFFFDVIY